MTHIVILTTWAAQRPAPDATEHMHFFDHDGFVALDSTSSRPEGPIYTATIPAGWAEELGEQIDRETGGKTK